MKIWLYSLAICFFIIGCEDSSWQEYQVEHEYVRSVYAPKDLTVNYCREITDAINKKCLCFDKENFGMFTLCSDQKYLSVIKNKRNTGITSKEFVTDSGTWELLINDREARIACGITKRGAKYVIFMGGPLISNEDVKKVISSIKWRTPPGGPNDSPVGVDE